MSFKLTVKHWWMQIKSGHAYVNLIRRERLENGEYSEYVDFILRDELPEKALNVQNYGKYWYFLDDCPQVLAQDDGMRASDVCTWADNTDLDKALAELWSWTNNLDIKKVALVIGAVIVGFVILMMVR